MVCCAVLCCDGVVWWDGEIQRLRFSAIDGLVSEKSESWERSTGTLFVNVCVCVCVWLLSDFSSVYFGCFFYVCFSLESKSAR